MLPISSSPGQSGRGAAQAVVPSSGIMLSGPVAGRPLLLTSQGRLYIGRGYTILRSDDRGRSWTLDCTVPTALWNTVAASMRLTARLLRREISGLRVLANGARIAIARDGVYRAEPGDCEMRRTFAFADGRPFGVAVDGRGRLVFGEYRWNSERGPINIYVSEDEGRSFHVSWRFSAGEIRHVHAVTWDPFVGRCLIMTGDYGQECGIGVLADDLQGVDWIVRGDQTARAVSVIVEEQALIYGTDSHVEPNWIMRVDKASGRMEKLQSTEGSSLFAARFGPVSVITTCVEPSTVNLSREIALYVNRGGERWCRAYAVRKDRWHTWFQFGTLILPHSESVEEWGALGGQAVEGVDGQTWLMAFEEPPRS